MTFGAGSRSPVHQGPSQHYGQGCIGSQLILRAISAAPGVALMLSPADAIDTNILRRSAAAPRGIVSGGGSRGKRYFLSSRNTTFGSAVLVAISLIYEEIGIL